MRAYQPGFQSDSFAEECGAFNQLLLVKANGPQYGIGNRSRVGVKQGQPRLLIGFFQPTLLNKRDGRLEGLAPLDTARRGLSTSREARVSRLRRPEKQEAGHQ